MADFLMPSLGADMESGTLTEWHVEPGAIVKRGDIVASIETSKGIIDVEIFADGVIETLLAAPGDDVPVGRPLARYRPTGTAEPSPGAPSPHAPPTLPSVPSPQASAAARPAAARRPASPAARKRAAELGLDLDKIVTRAGGAITLDDVEQAAAARPAPASRPAAMDSGSAANARSNSRPTDMRGTIGQAMSRSKREIPHYYLATTIDMRSASRWLEQHNAAHPVTERLIYGVLLIKAVARAVARVPELNGWWREDRFDAANSVNVGTAIRLRDGGLIAPALLGADRRPLPELMRSYQDLVQRARTGGLRATELASATITVSSIGEGGVDTLYPIIHPPQVAIVGFGALVTRPWCDGESVVAARVINATLAADHRASDGHRGSAFLVAVADCLQRPEDL
jgi:pyruvate dehydrogenase E2 component (dihydrolipoyllysine-residue acetyltransferase)